MKTNLVLAVIGLVLILVSSIRSGLVKLDRQALIDLAPLAVATVVLMFMNFRFGGPRLAVEGTRITVGMVMKFMPLLVLVFLTMGQAMALVKLYQAQIVTNLSGGKGAVGALAAAFLMPGSMTSLPVVKELWEAGANKVTLLVFLLNSGLIGWQTFLIRQPMLGWRIALTQQACATILAVIVTTAAWLISSA